MQGFNMGRYVPPDVEGTISGNALNKKHALGARASKLRTEGILTVRFEMPFAVWCGSCPQPTIIGQGVRFNAEKKKVGAYYSTPIWSFRMRHADCGGALEIRTDPAAAEYVVVEGGSRRDTGDDKDDSLVTSRALLGDILPDREKEVLRHDAFARLEKTIEDRAVLVERSHRIAELEDASERAWEDPYAQNRRLRAAFRAGRHAREKEAVRTGALQARMSLGIDLLPATEEDARRAALVDFGVAAALGSGGRDESDDDTIAKSKIKDAALTKPLFSTTVVSNPTNPAFKTDSSVAVNLKSAEKGSKNRLQSEIKASQTRESLASTITRNTRASQDPFLIAVTESRGGGGSGGAEGAISKTPSRIQGIKRKRPGTHTPPQPPASQTQTCAPGKHTNVETPIGKTEEGGPGDKPENGPWTFSEAENTLDAVSGNSAARLKAALVEYDSD
ncbi:CWC16 protein [Nemania diffusa]|nr:CWC16 protein [Nemania diffusa]